MISEAYQVGLIDTTAPIDYQDYSLLYGILQKAVNWTPTNVSRSGMDRLTFLQSQLEATQQELEEIELNLSNAKAFMGETFGYHGEAQYQKKRLESIGLFEQLDFKPGECPLCGGKLPQPLPEIEMMKAWVCNLDKSIANVSREQPKFGFFY